MDTLEIPRFELMNYLPYFLIEEALEFNPTDLAISPERESQRKESRIDHYMTKKKSPRSGKLQSLISACDFEKEVSDEVNKILHARSLYDAFFNSMILDQTQAKIKTLMRDPMNKENINPNF
ncbi:hypothetical protein SteCoe_14788 [Stentor coeruleus]|uniref:Uncharacterized protein n=1 Tax=Stentor coeruleus TaxID=5963 RepID=A0A1R2C560_9CILI|nr:hypothetical protein SteCoe_14788 [Stentor coeruleus]